MTMTDDIKERFKKSCPIRLQELPRHWSAGGQKLHYCPLAVMRLKALRSAAAEGRLVTQDEEDKLPGCPWAIKSQMSGYCWFVYEATMKNEASKSDIEIASVLELPVDQVKIAYASATDKVLSSQESGSIKEMLASGSVSGQERLSLEDEYVYHE
jgi:hypothetical protein